MLKMLQIRCFKGVLLYAQLYHHLHLSYFSYFRPAGLTTGIAERDNGRLRYLPLPEIVTILHNMISRHLGLPASITRGLYLIFRLLPRRTVSIQKQ
jgi:hypothetical protein